MICVYMPIHYILTDNNILISVSAWQDTVGHDLLALLVLRSVLKMWLATISFIMSLRPHGATGLSIEEFLLNLILEVITKTFDRKI